MTTYCADCNRPTSRGRTAVNGSAHVRCLVCQVAHEMRDWRYPAARRQGRSEVSRARQRAYARAYAQARRAAARALVEAMHGR